MKKTILIICMLLCCGMTYAQFVYKYDKTLIELTHADNSNCYIQIPSDGVGINHEILNTSFNLRKDCYIVQFDQIPAIGSIEYLSYTYTDGEHFFIILPRINVCTHHEDHVEEIANHYNLLLKKQEQTNIR